MASKVGIGKLQTLYKVTPQLSRIIGGKTEVTRQEALKDVWSYIKSNNLQNPEAKREIIPDGPLKEVFGKDKVTMYEVLRVMNPHFVGKETK
jgi:chromatin remodeling complex protein RSC6